MASSTEPRDRVMTRCTPVVPSRTSASPSRTRSVAIPPLSPDPAELSSGSMSACRKSWAMVSPSARAGSGPREAARSTGRVGRRRRGGRRRPPPPRAGRPPVRPVARWPIADVAAIRTTSASVASVASRSSGAVAMECRTSPSVSTRRARASGAATPSSAPSTPTTSCSAVAPDHRSSVRWASMPVNPPSTTMPRSAPIPSARGSPEPSAQAACSRRKARSSDRRPTSIRPASPSNTWARAWVAAIAASSSSPRSACASTRMVRTPGSRPASKARSSARRMASTIDGAAMTASSAVWTPTVPLPRWWHLRAAGAEQVLWMILGQFVGSVHRLTDPGKAGTCASS